MNLEINKQEKFTAWTHMLHTVDSQCILKTGLSVSVSVLKTHLGFLIDAFRISEEDFVKFPERALLLYFTWCQGCISHEDVKHVIV